MTWTPCLPIIPVTDAPRPRIVYRTDMLRTLAENSRSSYILVGIDRLVGRVWSDPRSQLPYWYLIDICAEIHLNPAAAYIIYIHHIVAELPLWSKLPLLKIGDWQVIRGIRDILPV
jgi:hypothetical protein